MCIHQMCKEAGQLQQCSNYARSVRQTTTCCKWSNGRPSVFDLGRRSTKHFWLSPSMLFKHSSQVGLAKIQRAFGPKHFANAETTKTHTQTQVALPLNALKLALTSWLWWMARRSFSCKVLLPPPPAPCAAPVMLMMRFWHVNSTLPPALPTPTTRCPCHAHNVLLAVLLSLLVLRRFDICHPWQYLAPSSPSLCSTGRLCQCSALHQGVSTSLVPQEHGTSASRNALHIEAVYTLWHEPCSTHMQYQAAYCHTAGCCVMRLLSV